MRTVTLCGAVCLVLSGAAAQTNPAQTNPAQTNPAQANPAQTNPQVLEKPLPTLVADKTGTASITITLKNSSANALPLQLGVDPFTYKRPDDKTYQTPVAATFTGAPASLAQNATASVKVAISGLADAGEATSALRNSGVKFADLTAIRTPTGYNVQIDGSNEVVFAPDSQPSITIKNTDPMTYRFQWTLEIDGQSWEGGPVDVAASGSALVKLSTAKPEAKFFESGTIKDKVSSGFLSLIPQLPGGTPLQSPVRLPVKIRVRYWGSFGQAFWEFFCTALLLLIGGLASLLFRYFIPNALGAIRFRRQLHSMEQRLRGMGTGLASQWRVLLAAKLAECRERLGELPMFFPAFGTRLAEIKKDADMYNQWLEIAYNVSNLLDEARRIMQTSMPPTVMTMIERKCGAALEPIASGFTKPEELQAMQAALTAADAYVTALRAGTPIQDLEQQIKTRETTVQPQLMALTQSFPSFAGVVKQVADKAPMQITPDQYADRDTFSLQAALLCEYRDLGLRRGAAVFPPPAAAAAVAAGGAAGGVAPQPPTALDRMVARDGLFRGYVQPEAYNSLCIAEVLLGEMRKDFYPEALLDEVGKTPPAVQICADPSPIQTRTPIHFSLRFIRQELNEQAAIREWTCSWDFGDGSQPEIGWDAYYSFQTAKTYTVTVTLFDLRGNPIVTPQPITKQIEARDDNSGTEEVSYRRFSPEAKVEAMQLIFVLILALSGIWATARGKVEQLSGPGAALALIGIGFGADSLKNLMTQKPGDQ